MCLPSSLPVSLQCRSATSGRWEGTWMDWMFLYTIITVLNLTMAIIACYLVERPFMHLSKKLTFDGIHI